MPQLPQSETDGPRLRSDAAANRERILAAATIAVSRDGETVPMATIADEAGVGIGTLYRHYPTRPALLSALTFRSFQLVLRHARAAALSDAPAPEAVEQFFEHTITARDELILPMHGGPVIRDGKIVAATIMTVTMSCDHRVIDGATGARFLQTLKIFIEEPASMLL